MGRKLIIISLILAVSISFSGCLLVDNSTTFTAEDKEETKTEVADLTHDFFSYNEYDSTSNDPGYKPDKLMAMFKEKISGSVVTIDPIIYSSHTKSYTELKEELNAQQTIFEAQSGYNYKLLFEDEEGNNSYKIRLNSGNYTSRTATYDVLFQVFEEVEGKRLLTDNGIITFELEYINRKWKINHLLIDYRELGSIDL